MMQQAEKSMLRRGESRECPSSPGKISCKPLNQEHGFAYEEKAVEDYRSPRPKGVSTDADCSEALWSVPVFCVFYQRRNMVKSKWRWMNAYYSEEGDWRD
jgi:hypothetical protein